jgi:predicted CoA-binding protein
VGNPADQLIIQTLKQARVIALVGASANPARDSHEVMEFLQRKGHRVIPVNPGRAGQRCRIRELKGENGRLDPVSSAVSIKIFN